jgi:hypothetical protein
MTSRAHALGPVVLWLVEIGTLAFVAGGIFIFIVDPGNWPIALVTIVFFGFFAARGARMIVLRWRATVSGSDAN